MDAASGSLTGVPPAPILAVTNRELFAMAHCDDPFACAVREVTRQCGPTIWSDPGRLRSRLQYTMGPVSEGQSAVLDALVIAAVQGIPRSLLDHEDLQPRMSSFSDAVGPLLAADAVSTWMRALAEPERVCSTDAEPEVNLVEAEAEVIVESEAEAAPEVFVESDPDAMDEVDVEQRVLTLIDKLRPPPPVPVSA